MMNDSSPHGHSLIDSFANAFRGIWVCALSERNMRFHMAACCYVVFFALRLNLTRLEIAVLAITIGAVMSAETMNTAVEKLCNFTERRHNPHIRVIKDLAAGAVLLCALAAVAVGCAIFLREELWQVLAEIFASAGSAVGLCGSVAVAWVFVFVGPQQIAKRFKCK